MSEEQPPYAFGDEGDIVSVWVGNFGSEAAVDAYIEEQYGDDDRPISPFAEDIGLGFYDHDFFEVNHEAGLSARGIGAFAGHSYGESFAGTVCAVAQDAGLTEFDTTFLLYGYDHQKRAPSLPTPQRVRFVGTFPYVPKYDEWFERLIRGEFDAPRSQ
jgi:hypothetical protein